MSSTIKSPWLIHYDASSCNGCDIEVLACLTPLYDVERFGIINTGNPKHADIFLVTGSVNERNIGVLQQIYSQMLEPKVVIACGICACSGGVFRDCYNNLGGVDVAIPVDIYAPGCAVRPQAIIDAVVAGLGVLEEKRATFAASGNKLVPAQTLSTGLSAANKLVDGVSVRDAARSASREVTEQLSVAEANVSVQASATEASDAMQDSILANGQASVSQSSIGQANAKQNSDGQVSTSQARDNQNDDKKDSVEEVQQ